jgi:hypothetical protein
MEASDVIFIHQKMNKIVVLIEKSELLEITLAEGTQISVPVHDGRRIIHCI